MAEALAAVVGEELEVAVDVSLEGGVKQANVGGGGKLEGADGSGVGDYGDETLLGGGLVVGWRRGDGFEVEQATGDGGSGGVDFYAGAFDGLVEVGGGGVFGECEREGLELLREGRGGVVGGSGDAAAVEVDGGERLEDIVELGGEAKSMVMGWLPMTRPECSKKPTPFL